MKKIFLTGFLIFGLISSALSAEKFVTYDTATGKQSAKKAVPLEITEGGTGQSTQQGAINVLTDVSEATNEYVLTKDTATGNAIFKEPTGGGTANHSELNELDYASSGHTGFEPTITEGTTAQYWRGDKTWQTISHTSLSDIGTNTHATIDTFISSKGAASGLASLDASSKVVQNPVNATATPTASKIPISDANGYMDGWITRYIELRCIEAATDITTGTNKWGDFRVPVAMTVLGVGAYVDTAATGANLLTIDINEAGTTILSTKITLDASEKTSTTAATPPVISDSSIAADAIITVDVDQVGNTTSGKGLVVWLKIKY